MTKREFLAAGLGAGLALGCRSAAFAQGRKKPRSGRQKQRSCSRVPKDFPTRYPLHPKGCGSGNRSCPVSKPKAYKLPEPKSLEECAWLVDGTVSC